jgi:hypothetical protein
VLRHEVAVLRRTNPRPPRVLLDGISARQHHGCSTLNWIWIWPTFRDRAGPGVSPDGVTASW